MSQTPESENLELPPGLGLLEKIGSGRCAVVYRAEYQGEPVALKVYSSQAADWYRKKHNVNIAVFEMSQNRTFRHHPDLLPFTAKPIRVIGQDGKYSLCFLQEYIEGVTLEELGQRLGKLPGSLLEAGEKIAQVCRGEDIKGIDRFMENLLVREQRGKWVPAIHDFKHVPGVRPGKRPGASLLARLGLTGRSGDPGGFIHDWREMSARLERASAKE